MQELIAEMSVEFEKLNAIEKGEVMAALAKKSAKGVSNPTAFSIVKKLLNKQEDILMGKKEEPIKKENIEPKPPTEIQPLPETALAEKRDMTMAEIMTVSENLYKSRYWTSVQSKEQALAKVLAGRERGFGITTALSKFYVVNGNVGTSAEIMGAMIKRSKGEYDYLIVETSSIKCSLKFTHNGKEIPDAYKGIVTFTIEEAKQAGLIREGSGWTKYPSDMLFARCLSRGARRYCPHLIQGTYITEEIDTKGEIAGGQGADIVVEGEIVNDKKGDIPKVTPIAEQKPEPPSREELLKGLVEKFTKDKVKKAKEHCKVEKSLKECSQSDFDKVAKFLEK